MKRTFRKIIQVCIYYLVPIGLFILLYANIVSSFQAMHIAEKLGEYAFYVISLLLFIKPISILFPNTLFRKLITYRRELGILSFWLMLWHSVYLFFALELFSLTGLSQIMDIQGYLLSGVIAFAGMFLLGITSNRLATIKLKRNWKKLQILAYPTFAFICIHRAMAQDNISSYLILGAYLVLKVFEYIVRKKKRQTKRV